MTKRLPYRLSLAITLVWLCMSSSVDAQTLSPVLVTDLDWSSDGERIAVGYSKWDDRQYQQSCGDGDAILLIDLFTGQRESFDRAMGCSPSTVDFDATDSQILVASASTYELWDLESGEMMSGVQLDTLVQAASWSVNGTTAVITALSHVRITESDPTIQLSGFMPPRDPDITGLIYSAWSPDGEQVASSIDDSRIFVWSIATGQTLITFEGHSAPVKRLAWNPVSNVVASGDDSGTIWLWDADTGQPIRRMSGHTGIIYDVVWHPNGQELASAGEDGTVRIWEASTGRMKIVDQLELFSAVAYSPDGTQLAYAGEYTGENTVVELVSAPLVESPAPTPTRTPAIAAEE